MAVLTILNSFGLGYSDAIYKNLLQIELGFKGILFKPQIMIPIKFEDSVIRHFELKTPVINNKIICMVIALKEELVPSMIKMRTYLNDSKLPIGLIVHFGKDKLQIVGIRA